jgi:hypothetical protein
MKMSLAQLALAITGQALAIAILLGVARRQGLFRRCVSFVAYVFALLLLESLTIYWPSTFWNWPFWNFKQSTLEILKLAIAVELAIKALSSFPGTWRLAGRVNAFILLGTAAGWLFAGAPGRPLVNTATIWLFAGTALVATYFHIPLHAWHRAILFGFTAYLTVFSTVVNVWHRHNFAVDIVRMLGSLDQFAYWALIAFWAYSAWRPAEQFEGVAPEVLEKLNLAEEDHQPAAVTAT